MHPERSTVLLTSLWLGLVLLAPTPAPAQSGVAVSGKVTILERDARPSEDLAQTVVWLTGAGVPDGTPSHAEMATEGKQFTPRLVVVAPGSTVNFPNHDPFSHNVFSLSPEGAFDLGLYGRGGAKAVTFKRAGVIRVYCNVHAQMRGLILVVPSGYVTQPGPDGSFTLADVPAGSYVLHAWHERGGELEEPLSVGEGEQTPLSLTLDARRYRLQEHLDKNGQSYYDRESRY